MSLEAIFSQSQQDADHTGAPNWCRIDYMARGFDSKFIEAQQEEATRASKPNPALTPVQREAAARKALLELARARAAADLDRATADRARPARAGRRR